MESYKKFKAQVLKDPEIRKAYDGLGPEFEIIRALIGKRLRKGLTQTALARKLGMKQSAIARLESGTANPTIGSLQKVAHALDAKLTVAIR
ncbi:MAG: helix-turn-helix transcriptional regulator [Patescibacteria group bacterium]